MFTSTNTQSKGHDPPSFSSLPAEILHMILSYLSCHQLCQTSRVNHTLHVASAPHLWSTLKIKTNDRCDRFLADAAQKALVRNASFVRELDLPHLGLYENIFFPRRKSPPLDYHTAICTNIRKLWIPRRRKESFDELPLDVITTQVEQGLVALLQQNLSLTTLIITNNMESKILLRLVTQCLPNLKALHVNVDIGPWTAKALLENLPESIKTVYLQIPTEIRSDQLQYSNEFALVQPKIHHALETLAIDWWWSQHEELVLLPFLDSCSTKLRHFDYTTSCFNNERIRTALGRLGIEMRRLGFGSMPSGVAPTDQDLATIISRSSRWEEVDLSSCAYIGPLSVAALLDRCEHLRDVELSLYGKDGFSSKALSTLLSRCKNLELFSAGILWDPAHKPDPVILATDLLELEWASVSLIQWSCMIEVPRSHHGEDEIGVIQRQVYRKLAMQRGLQELRLGRILDMNELELDEDEEARYQNQCLEMTLASGLDELALLTGLELLDVSFMDHRIGVPELEWMARNWPKLKSLIGLFKNCLNPVPGAREWVLNNRARWKDFHEEDEEGEPEEFEGVYDEELSSGSSDE